MQIVRDIKGLKNALNALDGRVALVPTMGALHAGHMALVDVARSEADHVVVSIFVNPAQFGPNEDFAAYPRRERKDTDLLDAAGVALAWLPDAETMYPPGFATSVQVTGVTDQLDGAFRPGHFNGVATVVTKLFNQVAPDVAIFGEKDYQQLQLVRRLVIDLDLPVRIVGVPTQREEDGLAMSSRNLYLTPADREAARALPRALGVAAQAIIAGQAVAGVLDEAVRTLDRAGFETVDYVALCDAETLSAMEVLDRPARLLAAARIGGTRLIDNLAVVPAP